MRLDLDPTIDRVAREMTAGEPHPSVRTRVLDRIDTARGRPWRVWRVGAPLAAAALAALAIAIFSRTAPSPATPPIARQSTRDGSQPDRTETVPAPKPESSAALTKQVRGHARVVAIDDPRTEVAALAPPPLALPALPIAPISPGDSLRVRALDPPAPLDVAPLSDSDTEKENRP